MNDRHETKAAFARLAGLLFSGFMTKVYAAGAALYVGSQAYQFITNAFASVTVALGQ